MIHLAMNQVAVASSDEVAKIGDSSVDIEEGKTAECGMTFGITTGAQTESQLRTANPTHIVRSLARMCELILPAT
jgi:phosphoglycolate phosphatase-like HAD superfamily hydrolase